MARLIDKKLTKIHKRMILDFVGIIDLRGKPKPVKEIDVILEVFKQTNRAEYDRAYKIMVEHDAGGEAITTMSSSKASEIVMSNLRFQESEALDQLTTALSARIEKSKHEINKTALETIEKARNEFIVHKIKVGNKKAKEIKGVVPAQFNTLLELGQMRKNILMVGPAGCGKTYIAKQIADALELDFMSQSCSEGVSETVFTGRLLPVGKGGRFEYVISQFVRMYENGGVFLLDEFDASDPNVLVFLNQALAGNGFTLEMRADNPWVKKHKDFLCIACANTFGNGADTAYVGRNQMDAATLDRFKIGTVTMGYDETVEKAIIKERSQAVYEWGINIRLSIKEHKLNRIMSTRVMQDACDMVCGQDWTIQQISNSYFSDWSGQEKRLIGEW